MNDRREAAGTTNAPETGRPSVNNGLEVGRARGPGERGVAHAPAARAGAGGAACGLRGLRLPSAVARPGPPRAQSHTAANASALIAHRARRPTRVTPLGDSDTVLCVTTGAVPADQ